VSAIVSRREFLIFSLLAGAEYSWAEAIKSEGEPLGPGALLRRGMERFRKADIRGAVEDFDRLVKLAPESKAELWQRGIALYYAGEFAKGREQFEWHQTINPRDVENAVWHFLCVARMDGFRAAREKLIPIQGDTRIPMREIHSLFAGRGSEADVLGAARAGSELAVQKGQLFYAHLYLGLYAEAQGQPQVSLEHIRKAAGEFAQSHYMGDVARVHLRLREGR
jgi:lipoprotein NlpI